MSNKMLIRLKEMQAEIDKLKVEEQKKEQMKGNKAQCVICMTGETNHMRGPYGNLCVCEPCSGMLRGEGLQRARCTDRNDRGEDPVICNGCDGTPIIYNGNNMESIKLVTKNHIDLYVTNGLENVTVHDIEAEDMKRKYNGKRARFPPDVKMVRCTFCDELVDYKERMDHWMDPTNPHPRGVRKSMRFYRTVQA